jgi:hypothetical protein
LSAPLKNRKGVLPFSSSSRSRQYHLDASHIPAFQPDLYTMRM